MQERKNRIINARVTEAERTELKLMAKLENTTLSDLIRFTINNYKKTTKWHLHQKTKT